ncbi:GGDEF domain-containing protein, diguanylate cyclase (c-di-GMP synthetase) or its enzymatically inactive variants [Polaromonas sp. OV174]|uniref:sensor domain-containing diguanylate cyclase n=1 Tax=Polaromonas sp. OV174 TaxID=1855300 RepID=UPI0008DFD245|nr:7TM diverse intracellular signaling domain-containing protein [Polaromonas sp. OV174]SFB67150.1 GGDEF domain-containing protein, diguanylate cyclase (c-di-GMP synthetase) or its enzymatically inactive variants [Polaromonas sp. OV174]
MIYKNFSKKSGIRKEIVGSLKHPLQPASGHLFGRLLLSLLLGWLLLLSHQPAQARTLLELNTHAQPVALLDWGDYWIDSSGRFTAPQVALTAAIPWQPTHADAKYPVTGGDSLWIRFSVPPAPDTERWYLEVPYPAIDRASLYTLDGAGQWIEQRAGDKVAVGKWPVPHRHPLLPIALSAAVPTQYLLQLENGHAFRLPLQFISEGRLSHSEQRVSLILGIFFGLTGLAAFISALGAISLRDPAYGFFALCVTLTALTQATITGIGGLHLWPLWPWWNSLSTTILPLLAASVTLLFISAVVALPERSRRLHRLMLGEAGMGVLVAFAMALIPAASRLAIFVPVLLVLKLSGLLLIGWAWRRGDRFAPWLMLAYLPVTLGSGWALAYLAGLAPHGFLTEHGMQLGVALHLPVVMVVLMLRSQQRRENIRRIQGLDRVDPTTGLINGHVFIERLVRMMARCGRLRHQSAVMLIDLVNTEQIQRDFGRKAAEELPLRVAERLLSTAREIDSAARLSEHRFGMLVEGPFSAQDAATLGPRIVARCLMPYQNLHVECVAQVHVAYAIVPYQSANAQDLLLQLEDRLNAVPDNSRRAVFMLGDNASTFWRPDPAQRTA